MRLVTHRRRTRIEAQPHVEAEHGRDDRQTIDREPPNLASLHPADRRMREPAQGTEFSLRQARRDSTRPDLLAGSDALTPGQSTSALARSLVGTHSRIVADDAYLALMRELRRDWSVRTSLEPAAVQMTVERVSTPDPPPVGDVPHSARRGKGRSGVGWVGGGPNCARTGRRRDLPPPKLPRGLSPQAGYDVFRHFP